MSKNKARTFQRRTEPAEAQPLPREPRIHGREAPDFWTRGQLLNVRNAGPGYRVTVLGEEYDPRYPERCMEFNSVWECQDFVSNWYARTSHDPRAA